MKHLIVANWKMNPSTLEEAKNIFNQVKETGAVICPPFVYLSVLGANGAQDCSWESGGAFTGEISPQMLKDLGVEYVILGHSERRKYQKETNELIEKKFKAALSAGLKPILCIDQISQLPKDIKNEVQVILTVLSFDQENDSDVVGLIAASAALSISNIPWGGPLAGLRIGQINGEWVLNPSFEAREKSDLDLVMAAINDKVLMIEADGKEVPEETVYQAVEFSLKHAKNIIKLNKPFQK